MPWTDAYTPEIWVPLVTLPCLLALSAHCRHRRSLPGAVPLGIASAFAFLWVIGDLMMIATADVAVRIFWHKVQTGAALPLGSAMFCFALDYAWPGRWIKRRTLLLLSIMPLMLWVVLATDHVVHLMWHSLTLDGQFYPQLTPLGWVFLGYMYALFAIQLAVYVWLFRQSPQHRWPAAIIIVGSIIGRALYAGGVAHLIDDRQGSIALVIPWTLGIHVIALFGFRVFDPVPLARRLAMEQLPVGMLVLDPGARIAGLNPAAEGILGTTLRKAKGRAIRELLPAYPEEPPADSDEVVVEYSVTGDSTGSVNGGHHYRMSISLLQDWREMDAGRLVMLHDVTVQREAEAQLVRHQRALAMLAEREQLARELHDSTGQVLGYAGYQLEATEIILADGQAALSAGWVEDAAVHLAKAEQQLGRLSRIIDEAHADLRGEILNLRVTPTEEQSLFTTLQRYLEGYGRNYKIRTELDVAPGLEARTFEPAAQQHLFRIVQEGLSNARKHGRARAVQVSFEAQGAVARLCIEDNGCGFDPQQTGAASGSHLGLRFMRERAEQLGGSLCVASAPGTGTRVIVEVPVKV